MLVLVIWRVGLRVAASARSGLDSDLEAFWPALAETGTGTGFIISLQFVQFRTKFVESVISFEILHLIIFIIAGGCRPKKK